jgi:hypothetical protein
MKFINIDKIQEYFNNQDMEYTVINTTGNINSVYGAAMHIYTGALVYYYLFLDRQNKFNLKVSDSVDDVKIF